MSGGLIVNGIVDYYELLGVHDDVYSDEVKKAWRNVSKELHPDMQGTRTIYQDLRKVYPLLLFCFFVCSSV